MVDGAQFELDHRLLSLLYTSVQHRIYPVALTLGDNTSVQHRIYPVALTVGSNTSVQHRIYPVALTVGDNIQAPCGSR